jgi:pimeloyl-ACP methyl ester carboxylesterase
LPLRETERLDVKTALRSFFSFAIYAASLHIGICAAAANAAKPYVDDQIDPAKSFWAEYVHYPFPVKYAKAADGHGIVWEIAYMDEYDGPASQKDRAKTLVLIHGRGTNAGTWGDVMQAALRKGLRVIALDIPHYGKSIPRNVDKPLTRSLDDVRTAFHAVIADQLHVKKAVYLGHSLGGQIVFGYALKYPEAVERLIAVAPGGLEEFSPSVLFDPSLERDIERWDKVWQPTGLLDREFGRPPYTIEPDYYFNGDGRSLGYFFKDGVYPRFITDTRVKMIAANDKEYRNYITTYVHEGYTVGIELQKNDPHNLNKRLSELKMPILLLMGELDPFYPLKSLSGNSDVKLDMIKPFFDKLNAKGNPPQVKIYAGAGHFLFTDYPAQFESDVLAFVDGKSVSGREDVAAYRTTWLRALGIQKFVDNLLQELVWNCYSKI